MDHDESDTQPLGGGAAQPPPPPTPGDPPSSGPSGPGGGAGAPNMPPPPSPWFQSGGVAATPPGGWWAQPGSLPPEPSRKHSGRKLAAMVGAVALLAGGLGAALDAVVNVSPNTPGSQGPVTTLPKSSASSVVPTSSEVSSVASAIDPAVVDINTTVASEVGNGAEAAAGTGMILSRSGVVLTNNHVVESATSIKVSIQGHSGSYRARVLGVDPTQDVALIKIESPPSGLSFVSAGDSGAVTVGTSVVAIGNALGLGGKPSVSSGTITATNRTITAGDELTPSVPETLHHLFETDAPIQSGDSGGPLVNLRGQVVGMDTAAASSDSTTGSLGFAIPINEAMQIVNAIEAHHSSARVTLGLTAFLGITEQTESLPLGNSGTTSSAGVFISNVIVGSPAQHAGLRAGDSITSIDGTTTNTIKALQSAIRSHRPGQSISITYTDQNGANHSANVRLSGIPL